MKVKNLIDTCTNITKIKIPESNQRSPRNLKCHTRRILEKSTFKLKLTFIVAQLSTENMYTG